MIPVASPPWLTLAPFWLEAKIGHLKLGEGLHSLGKAEMTSPHSDRRHCSLLWESPRLPRILTFQSAHLVSFLAAVSLVCLLAYSFDCSTVLEAWRYFVVPVVPTHSPIFYFQPWISATTKLRVKFNIDIKNKKFKSLENEWMACQTSVSLKAHQPLFCKNT